MSDTELLQRYIDEGESSAFSALVERHVDLVYSVARRHVGSSQLAEDVAQSVFIELARRASRIKLGTPLIAWLHLVSRRIAINAARDESRRHAREHAAAEIAEMKPNPPQWDGVEPLLDEAVESLPALDRTAILLRYFQNKSLREVGAALGISEDAAQKRVSRAIEHLRAFFLRRGIGGTAASLATDLSAHALHAAPTGLGAAITSAAISAVPHAALSAATTVAMATLQKLGVAAALVAAVVVVYEAAVIRSQGRSLDELRGQIAALDSESTTLRTAREMATDRLALVQAQIDARRAQAAATASLPGDAALETQMGQWLAQLDELKRFVAGRRHLDIPELQFLSEQDWFRIAAGGPLATEEDFRKASSGLRRSAENRFASKLHQALTAYVKANGDRLPEAPQELLPFFDPAIDPALLDRYEMIHRGRAADVPAMDRTRVIAPKVPADVEHDAYYSAGLGGYGNTSAMGYNLAFAEREFRKANPGQNAATAVQLMPYLKWPVGAAALQSLMDRRRSWQMQGEAR